MKFSKLSYLAGVTGVLAMAFSCSDNMLQTKSVEIDMAKPLAEGRRDSIKVNVSVDYVVGNDDVSNAMNESIINLCFGGDYAGMGINAAAAKWTDDNINEYTDVNLDLLKTFAASDAESPVDTSLVNWLDNAISVNLGALSWENQVSGSFSGRHDNVVSYTAFHYSYTGGAHGSSVETAVNFDVRSGKVISEEEFFVQGYKSGLASLLTSRLSDAMPNEEAYDALFIKDIEPNGNFMVSEESLTYIYGQYEIGPYYLGIIKVSIPWEELGDLVRVRPAE